jgi:putative membrane protein
MSMVLINYGHYLALAALFAGLAVELALFRPRVDGLTARKLALADSVYGSAALVILATGLLKVFMGDKPASYYGHNPLFHIKVTLYVVVFALAVFPAAQFLKRRRAAPGDTVEYPGVIGTLLKVELMIALLIPLLAVMMARGFGFGG